MSPDRGPEARPSAILVAALFAAGALCIWASDPGLEEAVKSSPHFITWLGLMISQFTLAGAGLLPAWRIVTNTCKPPLWGRWAIWLGLISVLVLLALPVAILPEIADAGLFDDSPFQGHHKRMTVATVVCIIPTLFATAAMWMLAAQQVDDENLHETAANLLERRRSVRGLFAFIGLQVGAVTLTTGALRMAMIDGDRIAAAKFPIELVFVYAGAFMCVLILIYLPAHLELNRQAQAIRQRDLAGMTGTLDDWLERRASLGAALGIGVTWTDAIQSGIPILMPVLGALVSTLLGL